jgi:hypothetical protein
MAAKILARAMVPGIRIRSQVGATSGGRRHAGNDSGVER